jgi:hypothetical protein
LCRRRIQRKCQIPVNVRHAAIDGSIAKTVCLGAKTVLILSSRGLVSGSPHAVHRRERRSNKSVESGGAYRRSCTSGHLVI